ncbi:MAG TPA: carbohydrate-binding protein, partial [Anaerohalosphaeraceae bacterium]|nr:carbohydrate-binding protein [Anaerohalosphaeraceae bacterium]
MTKSWTDGVFTLTVQHNGPLDITVNCAGTATGRLTDYTPAVLAAPAKPLIYTGPLQYEGECFDYKYISGIVKGGYSEPVRNYTGQGYLRFGTNSAAAVRDTVTVPETGTYTLETRYSVVGANITTIDLYVNEVLTASPVFTQTATLSDWAIHKQAIFLNAGPNTIEFRARAAAASSIYFDNIVIVPTVYSGGGIAIQENRIGFLGVDGIIDTTDSGYTGDGYADTSDSLGAGIDWEVHFDSSVTKSFTFQYACPDNRTADLIVDGVPIASNIQFPSTGSWSDWKFVTVYARADAGVSDLRLQSTSGLGLPHIDYIQIVGILPLEAPAAPTGLKAMASAGRIDLTWDASDGTTSYNVKRSIVDGGPYSTIASTTETSYSDTELSELTMYYYVVSAVNSAGQSPDSV